MQVWPGSSYPLGATYDGMGTNFSLFSEIAERVEGDRQEEAAVLGVPCHALVAGFAALDEAVTSWDARAGARAAGRPRPGKSGATRAAGCGAAMRSGWRSG